MDLHTVIFLASGFLMNLGVLGFLTIWLSRQLPIMQESLEAIMHGQEHIAELAAEVLRRVPPRPEH